MNYENPPTKPHVFKYQCIKTYATCTLQKYVMSDIKTIFERKLLVWKF